MPWGTEFKADIFISRVDYKDNIGLLEDDIDVKLRSIQTAKEKIVMFVAANPRDIVNPDWKEQPIDWLNTEINNLFGIIEEDQRRLFKLELYLEYLKELKAK